MNGLKYGSCRFWQRTDLPPGSNMLRLAYADYGSACKLAGVQIIPLPTLANHILARTFFRSVANLFASPAVVCTLYCLKWATSVEKRHWLPISEARRCSFARSRKIYGSPRVSAELSSDGAHFGESNSRSNVFQIPSRICLRAQPLESSLGRVPQAADCTCNKIS